MIQLVNAIINHKTIKFVKFEIYSLIRIGCGYLLWHDYSFKFEGWMRELNTSLFLLQTVTHSLRLGRILWNNLSNRKWT